MSEDENQPQDKDITPQPDPLTLGKLISLAEAAKLSGLSPDYLRKIAEKGRLRAEKIGRNWITTLEAVEQYKQTRSHILKDV